MKTQLVHFLVNKVRMCAYLKDINKVLPLVALEKLPGGPSYLVGIMNLKGKNIPVIDLANRLGMIRQKKFSLDMPMLLCSNQKKEIAMIVDDIEGLSDFDEAHLQNQKEFDKPNSPYLATITENLNSSLLINISHILEIDIYASQNESGV